MIRSELVKLLNTLPDIEVGNDDGSFVTNAELSSYDDETGTHDYITLYIEEDF